MSSQEEFQETIVSIGRPTHFYHFLVGEDGSLLGLDDDRKLVTCVDADDRVVWDHQDGGVKHVATGTALTVELENDICVVVVEGKPRPFKLEQGPEKLPSEYLSHMRREGWVCLTCILSEDIVDGLQKTAGTDAYEHLSASNETPKICQHESVGRAISEPVSLWLIRQYMQTRDLHLGHPPGFAVLKPYDGASKVQGWHSDIPYTSSIGGNIVADRKGPIKAVQRNVCVSDFKKSNGATAYKLGSHVKGDAPTEWNPARHLGPPEARPYSGPEAEVLEAPAGSIILYDARTWHRAGFNHSQHKRAAMLSSFQAGDVIPKRDTRPACKKWQASSVYPLLNARQQRDITELLMNQPESQITAES